MKDKFKKIPFLISVSYIIVLPLFLLIFDLGSYWRFSLGIFIFLSAFVILLEPLNYINKQSIEDGYKPKPCRNFNTSYSGRIFLTFLGSLLLLFFIVDVITSYEIGNIFSTMQILLITFSGSLFSWLFALCDPEFKEIDFNRIRKRYYD